jgi:hypothetical protein
MGGVFSSSQQVLIPLKKNDTVSVEEVEKLSNQLETMIIQCSKEKSLIKSKYNTDPKSVDISSCVNNFIFFGNPDQTFKLLKTRYQDKVISFELGTKYLSDPDDDANYSGSVYFFERSVIKVIV